MIVRQAVLALPTENRVVTGGTIPALPIGISEVSCLAQLEDVMKIEKNERVGYRTFAFGGGVVGLITFLATGLLPSIVYGGFAGVTLAAAMFGAPVDASLIGRGVVLFGMVVGLLGTAAIYVVVGAALGAGVFHGARAFGTERQVESDAATQNGDA